MLKKSSKTDKLLVFGSPIVDVFRNVDETFITSHDLPKGRLHVIPAPEVHKILAAADQKPVMIPGGSAANTASCVGSLGSSVVFVGGLAADPTGDFFAQHLSQVKVENKCVVIPEKETTQVHVFISDQGARTMLPIYSASRFFKPENLSDDVLDDVAAVFTDAYQFDAEDTRNTVHHLYAHARKRDILTIFTLSDLNCVKYYRHYLQAFLPLVDILIGHEEELMALFSLNTPEDLMDYLGEVCPKQYKLVVITKSEHGSVIFRSKTDCVINKPVIVKNVLDQTGAGDSFAAGFLYAYLKGFSLPQCGYLASRTAFQVISQIGAVLSPEAGQELLLKL